ncbi:MAG: NACHT domain-containing protein [Symploca sp. SIO2D2]|nr:NACHT domain-containing protein [Symploca sp. SIO2D2]
MSLSLTALKILVTTIAKTQVKSLDIDDQLLNTALEQTIDIFTSDELLSDSGAKETLAQNIDKIAKQIKQKTEPLFELEARNLDRGSKNAIVLGVAETLLKVKLTPDVLTEIDLDGEKLKGYLLKANPEATNGFSSDEKALYRQAVVVISQSLIEAAPQLEGFGLSTTKTMLQRTTTLEQKLEDIANQLKGLKEQSIQAADEFARRYRRIVQDELDRLEVFGLRRMDQLTSRQSLSMAYITLSVSGVSERHKDDEKSLLRLMGDEQWEPEWGRRSRPIDEVICNYRRLVIRGAAGAGKSTLLQWLAVQAASDNFPQALQPWNYKIPFFIRLRSLVGKEFPTPEQFPALIARNIADTMPSGWVHRYLQLGQALVLLDGVDELPRQEREDFFEALKDLVRDFSQVTYIITSRPSGLKNLQGEEWQEWEDWVKDEGFVNLTLEPMSGTNVEQFIQRWHSALASEETANSPSETPEQIAENLKRQLRQRQELRQLASTPLLCAMICALHRDRQETLPTARLQLYQECIDMLLNRRDEGRKIKLDDTYPRGLNEAQKTELLQSLALKLMRLNRSNLEADRVDSHFDLELKNIRLPATVTGKQIRDLFVDRAGLLREPIVGQIDFAHRTFQEYLAAKAALDEDSLEELLQKVTDDQWRESIIVAAGLARPKERVRLLNHLIKRRYGKAKTKQYLHLLAVACLETATKVDQKTRDRVLTRAERLLPPKDDDEVAMVARAGNEIVPLLKYKSHYSVFEARKCIETLVQIGTNRAMETLVDYAKATFESEKEQDLIGLTIVRGWDIFEQSAYYSQVLSNLETLILEGNQISDASLLKTLTQLKRLNLSLTQISDILPLSSLIQLEELNLSYTQVTDISPLSRLTQLKLLNLSDTQVTDISPLSRLTQLKLLNLSDTQVTDISPLSRLTQIQELDLFGTQVKDIFPLSGLTQLKLLNLSDTQVTDVSSLSGLTQLKLLNLSKTKVTDVSLLSRFTRLKLLNLSDTQVTDVSSLSGLTQLKLLNLSKTKVTDVSPLSGLTQLEVLYLSKTKVTDVSPLKHLSGLKIYTRNDGHIEQFWAISMNIADHNFQALSDVMRKQIN